MSEYDRLKAVEMRKTAEAQEACADAIEVSPHMTQEDRVLAARQYRNSAASSRHMAEMYETLSLETANG